MILRITSFKQWLISYLIALFIYLIVFPQANSIMDNIFRIILSILAMWLVFIGFYHLNKKINELKDKGKFNIKIKF